MGSSYSKPAEVKSVHFDGLKASLPSMEGKVVAITGCTTGTGYVCAKVCLEKGAHVIMLNRASARADAALEQLKAEVPGAKVELVPCDLMSFDSVRQAGSALASKLTRLDALCNNAGIMATKDEATVDGFDTQMQTNHLSHFLLTSLVWPLLEKTPDSRVVNHSSMARKGPRLEAKYFGKNGGKLGGDKAGWFPFTGPRWDRYHQTKLANLAFTYALQARQDKVKVCVAHPGLAATNLQVTSSSDGGMGATLSTFLMGYGAQSAEDGAMGILRGVADPNAKSGDFYGPVGNEMAGKAELMPPAPELKLADKANQDLLWTESKLATGAKFPFETS